MAIEHQEQFQGFDPASFEVECAGCGNSVNKLSNFVRAAVHVEREIPYFDMEASNGTDRGKYSGRDEGGVFHSFECLVAYLSKAASDLHRDGVPRLMLHDDDEHPYGEDDKKYQTISEKHNAEIKEDLIASIEETL